MVAQKQKMANNSHNGFTKTLQIRLQGLSQFKALCKNVRCMFCFENHYSGYLFFKERRTSARKKIQDGQKTFSIFMMKINSKTHLMDLDAYWENKPVWLKTVNRHKENCPLTAFTAVANDANTKPILLDGYVLVCIFGIQYKYQTKILFKNFFQYIFLLTKDNSF